MFLLIFVCCVEAPGSSALKSTPLHLYQSVNRNKYAQIKSRQISNPDVRQHYQNIIGIVLQVLLMFVCCILLFASALYV